MTTMGTTKPKDVFSIRMSLNTPTLSEPEVHEITHMMANWILRQLSDRLALARGAAEHPGGQSQQAKTSGFPR